MAQFEHSDLVEVRRDPVKGRCVFARRRIGEWGLIERVPVLLIPKNQVFGASKEPCYISGYVFDWGEQEGLQYVALALGYGSLYNHSYQPNALFRLMAPDVIEFLAIKPIEPNEEITVNYNGHPDDDRPVDFLLAR